MDVKIFEAYLYPRVLQYSRVLSAGEQRFVNVLGPRADHVARAKRECGGLGVLDANSHGCKLGRIKVAVDESLRDVSQIQIR